MKKVVTITILILLIIDFAFAHYKAKANQRCRTFRKRYIAEASATEFGIGPRVWSRRCDNAHARAESGNGNAIAQATANDSQVTGFAWTRRWFARAGESNSNNPSTIDGIPENTKSFKKQYSALEGIHIDPINGSVYISSLSSKLDIASDDQLNDFAAFRITIVLEDAEDTLVAPQSYLRITRPFSLMASCIWREISSDLSDLLKYLLPLKEVKHMHLRLVNLFL